MFTRQLARQISKIPTKVGRINSKRFSEYTRQPINIKPISNTKPKPKQIHKASPIPKTKPMDKEKTADKICDVVLASSIVIGGAAAPYALYEKYYGNSYFFFSDDKHIPKSEKMKITALLSIIGVPMGCLGGGICGVYVEHIVRVIFRHSRTSVMVAGGIGLLALPSLGYIYLTEK